MPPVLRTCARALSVAARTLTLAICTFVPATYAANVVQISAGTGHSAAIDSDSILWMWGANTAGQLGNGNTSSNRIPLQIGTGYAQVSAGHDHTLAIKTDGTLWAWGANAYGQLGNGSFTASTTPIQIGSGFKQVSAARAFSVALKQDGSLWTWGINDVGQLGNGKTNSCSVATSVCLPETESGANRPTQVATGFTAISAKSGSAHALALKADGSVWAWGLGESGQIGNGKTGVDTLYNSTPVQVLTNATKISAGRSSSFAVKTDGTLWAWGSNTSYQLGTGKGNYDSEQLPVKVGEGYLDVSVGGSIKGTSTLTGDRETHTLALKADGNLWAWGQNQYGQLGNGAGGAVTYQFDSTVTTPTQVGSGYSAISAGGSHSLAVKADGTLWAWGSNTLVQTGLGLFTNTTLNGNQHTPQSVVLGNSVSGGLSGQGSLSNLTLGVQLRPLATTLGQNGHAFLVAAAPNAGLFAFDGTNWLPFNPATPSAWKSISSCLSTSCTPQTATLFSNLNLSALEGTIFYLGYGFGTTPLASLTEMLTNGRFKSAYTLLASGPAQEVLTIADQFAGQWVLACSVQEEGPGTSTIYRLSATKVSGSLMNIISTTEDFNNESCTGTPSRTDVAPGTLTFLDTTSVLGKTVHRADQSVNGTLLRKTLLYVDGNRAFFGSQSSARDSRGYPTALESIWQTKQ